MILLLLPLLFLFGVIFVRKEFGFLLQVIVVGGGVGEEVWEWMSRCEPFFICFLSPIFYLFFYHHPYLLLALTCQRCNNYIIHKSCFSLANIQAMCVTYSSFQEVCCSSVF